MTAAPAGLRTVSFLTQRQGCPSRPRAPPWFLPTASAPPKPHAHSRTSRPSRRRDTLSPHRATDTLAMGLSTPRDPSSPATALWAPQPCSPCLDLEEGPPGELAVSG